MEEPLIEKEEEKKKPHLLKRLMNGPFERSFISNLAFLYVNGGFQTLYTVALQKMLKNTYAQTPTQIQLATAFI